MSGITLVKLTVPAGTDWIGVHACGGWSAGEDLTRDADGTFSIQWDTQMEGCSNGSQTLDTYAFKLDGSQVGPNAQITVNIQNAPPPPPPPPGPCDPTATPGPAAGLSQVWADCFDVLDRTTWCSHQWWEPSPPVGSQSVDAGGILHLKKFRSDGFQNTTMSTEPCGQANPHSFQTGYFEARMRYDTVRGQGPAFWLFSTAHAENGDGVPPDNWPNPACANPFCLSAELDIFEGFGNINYGGTRTDDFFSGTLHRNACGCYGVANSSRFVQAGTGLDLSQWHVYAARWTNTTVSFYIDDQLQGSVATFDSFAQPMHVLLYNWNTDWEDENLPDASTPDTLDVEVDWVRVWQ